MFFIPPFFLELCLRLPSLYFDWLLTCQLCLFFASQIIFFLLTWHYIKGKLLNFTCCLSTELELWHKYCILKYCIKFPFSVYLLNIFVEVNLTVNRNTISCTHRPIKQIMKVDPFCVFHSTSIHPGILWKSITVSIKVCPGELLLCRHVTYSIKRFTQHAFNHRCVDTLLSFFVLLMFTPSHICLCLTIEPLNLERAC